MYKIGPYCHMQTLETLVSLHFQYDQTVLTCILIGPFVAYIYTIKALFPSFALTG